MSDNTINLDFKGYILENHLESIPEESGVFSVYRCLYNEKKDSVSVKQLIYIGNADILREEIATHNNKNSWKSFLESHESLCFNYALIGKEYTRRAALTLIKLNEPSANNGSFQHSNSETITVNCSGKHLFIKQTNIGQS